MDFLPFEEHLMKNRECISNLYLIYLIIALSGYLHEQSRNDRDDYVTINLDNMDDDVKHNFDKCSSCNNQNTPYDYGSVMHYGAYAFSNNGLPTITTNNGESIGQRNGFSNYDIIGLNQLYPCGRNKFILNRIMVHLTNYRILKHLSNVCRLIPFQTLM